MTESNKAWQGDWQKELARMKAMREAQVARQQAERRGGGKPVAVGWLAGPWSCLLGWRHAAASGLVHGTWPLGRVLAVQAAAAVLVAWSLSRLLLTG